jgi:hypothetical protein
VFLHGCPDPDVAPIPVYQALLVAIPGLDITSSTPHPGLNRRFAAASRPQGSTLFLAFIVYIGGLSSRCRGKKAASEDEHDA